MSSDNATWQERESQYTITSRLGVIESSSKYIESVMKKKYFNFPFPTAHYVFFLITKKNQQLLSFIIKILFQGANSNMKKNMHSLERQVYMYKNVITNHSFFFPNQTLQIVQLCSGSCKNSSLASNRVFSVHASRGT